MSSNYDWRLFASSSTITSHHQSLSFELAYLSLTCHRYDTQVLLITFTFLSIYLSISIYLYILIPFVDCNEFCKNKYNCVSLNLFSGVFAWYAFHCFKSLITFLVHILTDESRNVKNNDFSLSFLVHFQSRLTLI
jgi:hypothetical protein